MIITIEGKQGEGKTSLAREIVKGKKAILIGIEDIRGKEWLSDLADKKEEGIKFDFLVIDGITDITDIQELKSHLRTPSSSFKIRRPYRIEMSKVEIPPNIILIRQVEEVLDEAANQKNTGAKPEFDMKRYKFRAECELDVKKLLILLPKGEDCHLTGLPPISLITGLILRSQLPDVEVTMDSPLDIEALRNLMWDTGDGHVMAQTLMGKGGYTGVRNFELRPPSKIAK